MQYERKETCTFQWRCLWRCLSMPAACKWWCVVLSFCLCGWGSAIADNQPVGIWQLEGGDMDGNLSLEGLLEAPGVDLRLPAGAQNPRVVFDLGGQNAEIRWDGDWLRVANTVSVAPATHPSVLVERGTSTSNDVPVLTLKGHTEPAGLSSSIALTTLRTLPTPTPDHYRASKIHDLLGGIYYRGGLESTSGPQQSEIGAAIEVYSAEPDGFTTSRVGSDMVFLVCGIGSATRTQVMWVASNLNVGIGIPPADDIRLHVDGDICAAGNWCSSDPRLKANIQEVEDMATRIRQLRPVTFQWESDRLSETEFAAPPRIGLLADEVEAQFPLLVRRGEDGYRSVSLDGLASVTLGAVSELSRQVDTLDDEFTGFRSVLSEGEAQALLQTVEDQQSRVAALEQTVAAQEQTITGLTDAVQQLMSEVAELRGLLDETRP